MNVLCIIPARGGSKGIPQKNIKRLAGKPLIAWSIEAALAADSINRLIVTTDDKEIASVAKLWGAETIHRPSELANDTASSESALSHVMETLKKSEEYEPDLIVFLQATSPYRSATDIDAAVNLLLTGYDSVFSAYSQHFTGRWKLNTDGRACPVNFDPVNRPRRQDQPVEYIENGSIYVFKPDILKSTGARMGSRIGIYQMPEERSYQIDEPEDLQLLEKLMKHTAIAQPNTVLLQPRIPPMSMLKNIQLLVLDFDGVLTDNRVWINDKGQETVCCSRSDSWGLTQLKKTGIQLAVISTESSAVVKARCQKLGITCISNTKDKAAALSKLAVSMKIDQATIAFIGNDTNDQGALRWANISILVNDAEPCLAPLATWILRAKGGQGAIRECCDTILKANQL
ncbi:MAG: acylneuraminate cytidylyltransferase [Desulfobacteraceae bacterium]|nr:acylneuraminate cytidylyltransferase [Desulfobacteraceae bacterium]